MKNGKIKQHELVDINKEYQPTYRGHQGAPKWTDNYHPPTHWFQTTFVIVFLVQRCKLLVNVPGTAELVWYP